MTARALLLILAALAGFWPGCALSIPPEPLVQQSAPVTALTPVAQTWTRSELGERTDVELSDGHLIALSGTWVQRTELWGDTSLVYFAEDRGLCVLDGASARSRSLWKSGTDRGHLNRDLTWSADGSCLFAWLDFDEQLASIDTRTGTLRSLPLRLGTHSFARNGLRLNYHFDPAPAPRHGGLVIDEVNGRLLLLLDEESNDQVAFWQRRIDRGGATLVAVGIDDGHRRDLIDRTLLSGARSWDLDLARGRLYTLSMAPDDDAPGPRPRQIEVRELDGALLQVFAEPVGRAQALQLSPDGRRLLVEREYRPDVERPLGDLKAMSRAELQALVAAQHGGFLVIDVESGEIVDGPPTGEQARWAPDGERIACIDGPAIEIASLSERTIEPLAVASGESVSWKDPVWSRDGRLAVEAGGTGRTVLLDPQARELFVLDESIGELAWGSTAEPFAGVTRLHH